MKALVYHRYGPRDVMALEDLPDPGPPGPGEVRVQVRASSINPVDGKVRRGQLKLIAGGRFPKRPGLDFSGVIEALGKGVSAFAVGDEVFGAAKNMSAGMFVEHALVPAKSIARKPSTLDLTRAAGVPTVGVAALQALRDIVALKANDEIVVNGCTGGVGLFALQIARQAGARVIGVCGSEGAGLATEFGADRLIDYRAGGVLDSVQNARAILELSGRLAFEEAVGALAPGGLFVDFSPSPSALLRNAIANPFRRRKHVFAMTAAKTADLETLARAIDERGLKPTPSQIFSLERYADAFALAEGGGVIGKIIVQITADA